MSTRENLCHTCKKMGTKYLHVKIYTLMIINHALRYTARTHKLICKYLYMYLLNAI